LWRDDGDMMMMVRYSLDGIVLMEMMVVRGRWAFDFWYPPHIKTFAKHYGCSVNIFMASVRRKVTPFIKHNAIISAYFNLRISNMAYQNP